MAQTYYRSEHPLVKEWWENHKRRWNAYISAVKALEAEFPAHTPVAACYLGKEWIIGLRGAECPGPLWQQRRGQNYWTPKLREKAGKELDARLSAIDYTPARPPGMPGEIQEHRTRHSPGCNFWEGVVWLSWAVSAEQVENAKQFDPAIWQRAKASEYHKAREEAEEASSLSSESD